MKTNRSNRLLSLLAGSALLAISSAQAQLYWDGNTTTAGAGNTTALLNRTWGTFAAWNTDSTGGAAGVFQTATTNTDDLFFVAGPSATSGNVGYIVTVDTTQVANSLNFQAPATTTISGGTSITLGNGTLGVGGITMNQFAFGSTAQGAVTISTALILNNSQSWTNNSANTLSWTSLNLGTGTLTFSGTGNFSSVTGGSSIAATAGSLIHNGSGLVSLPRTGTLAYTSTTSISGGGTLMIDDVKPVGNFNITNGILTDYYQTTHAFTNGIGLGIGNNQIQITGNSGFGAGNGGSTWRIGATGSTLVWGASGEGTATGFFNPTTLRLRSPQGDNNGPSNFGVPVLDNRLDLNGGTRTISVHLGSGNIGASRAQIDDGITGAGASSSLIKEGGGMLTIGSATSNWGGTTAVNAGILDFTATNIASIGGGSARNITIAANAGVRFNTLSNAILNRIVETNDTIMVMTGATINNFDFSSSTGANLPNAWFGNWAGNGAKAEIGNVNAGTGVITPGINGYLLGATGSNGLLGFVGTNKLTGSNTLTVGQPGASGIRVNLAGAQDFTGDTVINTGAKLTIGNPLALQNSTLNVGAAGGNFALAAGTNAGKITGETAAPNPTFGGLSGSRNLINVFTNAVSNNETNLARTDVTGFTLNVGFGKDVTYSGNIGGFGAGTTGTSPNFIGGNTTLTKTGAGTQNLTGTHTYTGATIINGGILDLGTTGSIASSTALILGSVGILDTSDKTTNYAIPATQSVTFGIDSTGGGSSGKIVADELDISNATVTFDIPLALDDAAYVLATYTTGNLTGTFLSAPAAPTGYTLDYAYQGNKIALVSTSDGDMTPPTLTSITDNVSGGPVNIGVTVNYTVTFNEDMNDSTVSAADFGNNGTATVTIGTVVETATPGVFTVPVTVNSPGTIVLRINSGADLRDASNNALVTTPVLVDDTTINVRNAYQSWALTNAPTGTGANDFDGDGVNNAIEFLLGGDKDTNDLSKMPEITMTATDMIVTFERIRSSIDGVTGCEIEVGTTLITWPVSYTVGTTTANSDLGVTVTENSPSGFDTITVTIPKGTDPKKFARLNVTVTE